MTAWLGNGLVLHRVIRALWGAVVKPIALVLHGSADLNHTRVFPKLQAMARPSLFQSPLLAQLQTQIQAQIKDPLGQRLRAMTGATGDARDFLQPAGDPGLFGPDSADWQVHAHFVAMMTGGLSSLMLQALHPRVLAAVWDHSSHAGAPTQLRTGTGRPCTPAHGQRAQGC